MYNKQSQHKLMSILNNLKTPSQSEDIMYFYTRIGANFYDIHRHFQTLYGERPDFDDKLHSLVSSLLEMFSARAEDLKKLDIQREQDVNWYQSNQLVGTMLYVDRYADNLAGLRKKLPYLRELGINFVHIMPVLKRPEGNSDGGYAVQNYREVDPRFGSMEELREIAAEFRKKGMHIALDLVLNHTADQHEWAEKARSGEKQYQDFYYLYNTKNIPQSFEQSMPEIFPETAPGNFTYLEDIQKWVMTVFHSFQWDLNYTNPDVFIQMNKVLLYLANQGIDILRLDAVPYLWKQMGTQCRNLPKAHTILQLVHACAKVVAPGIATIAEAIVEPNEVVKYFGTGENAGRECEICYHASLMVLLWDAMATKNTKLLTKGIKSLPSIPKDATWLTYIRCHDDIGLGFSDRDAWEVGYTPNMHRKFLVDYYTGEYPESLATGQRFMYNPKTGDARISGSAASLLGLEKALERGNKKEIETAVTKLITMYAAVMSFGGIPIIYYGDEVGYLNDYSYQKDESKKNDNRWVHRPVINWKKIEKRKKPGTVEQQIFSRMQALIQARKETPEFGHKTEYVLIETPNPHLFCFLRYLDAERTFCIFNFTDSEQRLTTEALHWAGIRGKVINKLTRAPLELESETIRIQPFDFLWVSPNP
ncbi:MAG: amylosucrase [Spirochaetia bacterium]